MPFIITRFILLFLMLIRHATMPLPLLRHDAITNNIYQ